MGSREPKKYARRMTGLAVDLNSMPVVENVLGATTEDHSARATGCHQHLHVAQSSNREGRRGNEESQRVPLPPPPVVTIDVEEIEDEVIICSPRRFAEAQSKSRRTCNTSQARRGNSEEEITRLSLGFNVCGRARPNPIVIDCDHYINLEDSNIQKNGTLKRKLKPAPSLPPPTVEPPTFSCPVCMGPLIEEMSTKCGHIFCKGCIRAAIKAQGKCPTCRRKVVVKDTIRIYLPSTN